MNEVRSCRRIKVKSFSESANSLCDGGFGEEGLYYYGARYLNPKTSMWISSDPAGPELMDPNKEGYSLTEGMNWYSYCRNNPVRYTDPTGLDVGKKGIGGFDDPYVKVAGDPTQYWEKKAKEARDSYKKSDKIKVTSTRWTIGSGYNKCNIFVDDELFTYCIIQYLQGKFRFGDANTMAIDWKSNPKLERITAPSCVELLQKAQALADEGYLILFAWYSTDGSGHVGFLGTSKMLYDNVGNGDCKNGTLAVVNDYPWAVAVQAGEYPGVAPLNYATNHLRDQINGENSHPLLTSANAEMIFYRVRK